MNTFVAEVSKNNQSEAERMENIVGRNIRRLRLRKDATQEAIASEIGISTSYMSHLEKGVRQADAELLFKLANVLGVSPQDFFSEEEREPGGKAVSNAKGTLIFQQAGALVVSDRDMARSLVTDLLEVLNKYKDLLR